MFFRLHVKSIVSISLLSLSLAAVSPSFATEEYNNIFAPNPNFQMTYRPIISLAAGLANTSNLSGGKSFPIIDPVTNQYFQYHPQSSTQSAALGDIFVGLEIVATPCFAVQAGVDYNQTSPFKVKGTFVQGPDALSLTTYSYQYHIQPREALFQAKLMTVYQQIFHPYLLLGAGWGINTAYHYGNNVPPSVTTQQFNDRTQTSLAYRVGIGFDVDASPNIRLGAGYIFTNYGSESLGPAVIAGTTVNGRSLNQNSMQINEVVGQITFLL